MGEYLQPLLFTPTQRALKVYIRLLKADVDLKV